MDLHLLVTPDPCDHEFKQAIVKAASRHLEDPCDAPATQRDLLEMEERLLTAIANSGVPEALSQRLTAIEKGLTDIVPKAVTSTTPP